MKTVDRLIALIRTLRRRCPWDRKQTLSTTRPLILNETFELDEALRRRDRQAIIEELGDYLFMGFFLAVVAEQEKGITLRRVIDYVIKKLKYRHPHVFGHVTVRDENEVLRNWERLKQDGVRQSLLSGIPRALPALQQAQLIQERCRRVGFDWEDAPAVLTKVEEEINELKSELAAPQIRRERVREELGDLLFALVNLCRHLNVDAEGALKDANRKFCQRFGRLERELARQGRGLASATLDEMEKIWQQIKHRG